MSTAIEPSAVENYAKKVFWKINLPAKTKASFIEGYNVERVFGFCFNELCTFRKKPPHFAHRSLKLACRSFSKLVFNKLKRTRINLVLFN